MTLEADRLAVPEVVLAAGSLLVVANTMVYGITAAPGRALYRKVAK